MYKKMIIAASLALAAMPFVAAATSYVAPNIPYWGQNPPILTCTGNYLAGVAGFDTSNNTNINAVNGQKNGCTDLNDLLGTAVNIIYFGMTLALFIIAPIMVIVGGIMIMVSGANPGLLESGKKTVISTAIGIFIVLCSYLIVYTLIQALGAQSFFSNFSS